MLGKLLKHELRATGRIMLPVFGVLVILSLIFNISVRLAERVDFTLLRIFFGMIGVAFFVGIIAAELLSLILMIYRFYKNLLSGEGYLMFTLPTDVHALVWSKLISSLIWIFLTNLLIFLIAFGTVFSFSATGLAELFRQFPSWSELTQILSEAGVSAGHLIGIGLECLLLVLLGGLVVCLHCYAAMALGHMFSHHKILFSVLFFVGISIVFRVFATTVSFGTLSLVGDEFGHLETFAKTMRVFMLILGYVGLLSLIEGAILYVTTTLSLKKGLNLA